MVKPHGLSILNLLLSLTFRGKYWVHGRHQGYLEHWGLGTLGALGPLGTGHTEWAPGTCTMHQFQSHEALGTRDTGGIRGNRGNRGIRGTRERCGSESSAASAKQSRGETPSGSYCRPGLPCLPLLSALFFDFRHELRCPETPPPFLPTRPRTPTFGELGIPEFFGRRLRASMTRATVEGGTAGLGQTIRTGRPWLVEARLLLWGLTNCLRPARPWVALSAVISEDPTKSGRCATYKDNSFFFCENGPHMGGHFEDNHPPGTWKFHWCGK